MSGRASQPAKSDSTPNSTASSAAQTLPQSGSVGDKLAQAFHSSLHIVSMTRIKRRFSLSSSRVKNLWFSDRSSSQDSRESRSSRRLGMTGTSSNTGGTKRKSGELHSNNTSPSTSSNTASKIRRQDSSNNEQSTSGSSKLRRHEDSQNFRSDDSFVGYNLPTPASKLRKTNKDTSITQSIPQCDFEDEQFSMPFKLRLHLDQAKVSRDEQIQHCWNNEDKSLNIVLVEGTESTVFRRYPVAQSTDCIRGVQGYTKGMHIWEIKWPTNQRGTHAVIGVATKEAPLHCAGYKSLIGKTTQSWGWDLGRSKLMHDYATNPPRAYPPVLGPDEVFCVPERVRIILDMDQGTLAYMVEDQYLGVAFTGLRGLTLHPIVSAVWGHCEIRMTYQYKPHDLSLKSLSRFQLRHQLSQNSALPDNCTAATSPVQPAHLINNNKETPTASPRKLSPKGPGVITPSFSTGRNFNVQNQYTVTRDVVCQLNIPVCLQEYLIS